MTSKFGIMIGKEPLIRLQQLIAVKFKKAVAFAVHAEERYNVELSKLDETTTHRPEDAWSPWLGEFTMQNGLNLHDTFLMLSHVLPHTALEDEHVRKTLMDLMIYAKLKDSDILEDSRDELRREIEYVTERNRETAGPSYRNIRKRRDDQLLFQRKEQEKAAAEIEHIITKLCRNLKRMLSMINAMNELSVEDEQLVQALMERGIVFKFLGYELREDELKMLDYDQLLELYDDFNRRLPCETPSSE